MERGTAPWLPPRKSFPLDLNLLLAKHWIYPDSPQERRHAALLADVQSAADRALEAVAQALEAVRLMPPARLVSITILLPTIYCGLPSCESVASAALARAVRGLLKVVSISALESYWPSSFVMIPVSHDPLAAIDVLSPR